MKENSTRQEKIEALKAELKETRNQCHDAQAKLAVLEHTEHMYNEALQQGNQLKAYMQGFIEAGFTEEQAYEIMLVSIQKYT